MSRLNVLKIALQGLPVLSPHEKRSLKRQKNITSHIPISCLLHVGREKIPATVLNFHFQGACLRVTPGDCRVLQSGTTLDLTLGSKQIRTALSFRVCWEEIDKTGQFGIEFSEPLEKQFRANEQAQANEIYPPTLVATHPTNPSRKIYFKIIDLSQSGLTLVTSSSNRAILPGMSLNKCLLRKPGCEPVALDLYIESVQPGKTANTFIVGASIRAKSREYEEIISEYAHAVSPSESNQGGRLDYLLDSVKTFSKTLKSGLTYRVIDQALDYEKVLKLRFLAYSQAGKIKEGNTWHDMGEGLAHEGTILGAFLGKELVGSVEIRYGNKMFLRTVRRVPHGGLSAMDLTRIMEPNRWVVHPKAQGTDIIIGIIQRIHAMAIIEGNFDVILLATDKLVPFYALMGARATGDSLPHALISGEKLNVMLIAYEIYGKGAGLNPHFWSQMSEVTHDYLQEMGMAVEIKETLFQKPRRKFGKILWEISRLKKNGPSENKKEPPALSASQKLIGKPEVSHILDNLGMPRDYFFKKSNWFSIAFFDQFKGFLSATPLLLGLGALGLLFFDRLPLGLSIPFVSLVAASLSILALSYLRTLTKYNGITREFDKYHQEADERYAALQKAKSVQDQNYHEANLLAELSKEIQKSDSLSGILNLTVSSVCKDFGFDRSLIMLIDREKNLLKTAAVSGPGDVTELLWRYSVDVSTDKNNPMVLSSAFLNDQPILIADVEAQKFQFNEATKRLIDKLKTGGFIIVPIPEATKNWGVILADKASSSPTKVNRRDLVMLQRAAQILGLALDKKSKFEQEEKMRIIFQKYVPSRIINGMPPIEEQVLGGTSKEITCMFIDIRGFTYLSEKYPSEIVLDVLNKFFTLIQKVVSRHNGIIDKFLGDGVLATWGTGGEKGESSVMAVTAALEVLADTSVLNVQLGISNFPSIEIGIGINTGPALVGNVGSQERMEFTAIGPTVNIASRLQSLCKIYPSRVIVSESVLRKNPHMKLPEWKIIDNVQIRGVKNPVRIGTLFEPAYDLSKKEPPE